MERIHCQYKKYKWPDGRSILACEVLEIYAFYRLPLSLYPPKKKIKKFDSAKSTNQFSQTTCRECRRSKAFHVLKQHEIAIATPYNQRFSWRILGIGPASQVQSKRVKCRGTRCHGQCPKHAKYYNFASQNQKETKKQLVMSRTRPARIQPPLNEEE